MHKRNILCLFLILVMVIALPACSFNNANSTVDKSESPSNTVTDDNNTFTDDNNNGTSDDTGNVDNKEDDKDGEDDSFIEKEQPELNEESKALIAAYQKNPTEENYLALRDSVIKNYNSVLAHKESKLAELKEETLGKYNGEAVVAEMDEIVQDMYITYWEHINSSMLRFTDNRLLRWKIADAVNYEYIPVMGAGQTIYVSRIPVTNAQYKQFITDTGYDAPSNWVNGNYPQGEDDFPVNYVSYTDAEAYCAWLTQKDGKNAYRLPNESEWELAAGHMPKDADFNCSINDGRVSVFTYDGITRGAHGAIDFWGNVWEWTSTARSMSNENDILAVKGGSWKSERTECRTEHRKEGRNGLNAYDDVGFRVIRVSGGKEPEQKVELATLEAPIVTATSTGKNSIQLSWTSVDKAVLYQVFEYNEETKLFRMLQSTADTTMTIDNVDIPSQYRYVVQAVSYVEFSDNISSESGVKI